jgi:hypothetical protein
MRTREEITEGIFTKEVRIKGIDTPNCHIKDKVLQPKQVDPLKLNLALLEVLLDLREQNQNKGSE